MTEREFSDRIRGLREERGLSQLQFAAKCNMHEAHIATLERGNRYPRYDTILKLAHGLGITPSELIAEDIPRLPQQDVFLNQLEAEVKPLDDTAKRHLLKIVREYVKAIAHKKEQK